MSVKDLQAVELTEVLVQQLQPSHTKNEIKDR